MFQFGAGGHEMEQRHHEPRALEPRRKSRCSAGGNWICRRRERSHGVLGDARDDEEEEEGIVCLTKPAFWNAS